MHAAHLAMGMREQVGVFNNHKTYESTGRAALSYTVTPGWYRKRFCSATKSFLVERTSDAGKLGDK
jgi:hypothetical protein